MNILVISPYPTKTDPVSGIFVHKIVQEFVKLNNKVNVISPVNYNFLGSNKVENLPDLATVIRPSSLSFSNKKFGFFDSFYLTRFFKVRCIRRTINNMAEKHDIVYCHFLISALNYLDAFPNPSMPIYLAVGENHWIDLLLKHYGRNYFVNALGKINGFIAVSHKVKDKLLSFEVPKDKIIVEPNATNLSLFKPRNKNELRLKYKLPTDKKIVLFVGSFSDSKGSLRVQSALDFLEQDVVAIFIGKGSQQINHPKVVFVGSVEHNIVAEFMSLSDVFVLPTLHEGSCNAIIEAMASGLPIVSSDIDDIRVQCKPEYSILVNPMSVNEIAEALNKILHDNELRSDMGAMALAEAKTHNIINRAERILEFINNEHNNML